MILDEETGDQYGYFILRPELFVDPLVGERVTYAEALAAHSDPGTVPMVHISDIATGWPSETSFGGVPSFLYTWYAKTEKIFAVGVETTYDRGGTDVLTAPDGGSSVFLVELAGVQAGYTVDDSTEYSVRAVASADGGQTIRVGSNAAHSLQDLLTDIKIWRLSGTWEPPEPPTPAFWTNFLGSREIL